MPVLDPNNLPLSPTSKAMEIWRAQLEAAQGLRVKLNQSCKFGVDAILADALEGKLPEASLPCVRIAYGRSRYRMASNAGVALYHAVTVNLFFLYSVGKPGGSILPVQFAELRDRHIRWNLEYLKDKKVKTNDSIGFTDNQHKDDAGQTFWWWPDGEQDAPQEDDTPFDIFGINIPINPSSGMACSRVDFEIMVKNHATFNS